MNHPIATPLLILVQHRMLIEEHVKTALGADKPDLRFSDIDLDPIKDQANDIAFVFHARHSPYLTE